MRNLLSAVVLGLFVWLTSFGAYAGPSPLTPPRLVVVVVIDQFRADMLTRYAGDFIKPRAGNLGGFQYLMQKGAYYPFAQYQALEDMTCPGHATISTGANGASNGITINDWYDRATKSNEYCVGDKVDGESPRHLIGTTFGDELRMAHPGSHVVSISLKDRAAILLGGHNPSLALWYTHKLGTWGTSTYYSGGKLPAWVTAFNAANPRPKDFEYESATGARIETRWSLDLALRALHEEKLGRSATPDVLLVSLSSHDIMGHRYGPESTEIHDFTVYEDAELARFFAALKKELGSLDKVVLALTADHGGAPKISSALAWHLDAGTIDQEALIEKLNSAFASKFSLSSSDKLFVAYRSFHFYLSDDLITQKKISRDDVMREAKRLMMKETGVSAVFTAADAERGAYPPGMIGEALKNSYLASQSGDVILIPRPYYFEKSESLATHMTAWVYDRTVPLIIAGPGIKPGIFSGAHLVDLAPTLSFILGVLPPATSEGHVLEFGAR